jgi:hypothetical protein
MTSKPEEYRAQALHCRLMADQVKSPLDKELWLQLAADWMAMASIHERFHTGQTKSEAQDYGMCQSCVEIDKRVERHLELLRSTTDPAEIERIKRLISELYADRAGLHQNPEK